MIETEIYPMMITIRDVKAMIAEQKPFSVSYKRCGVKDDGRPLFVAIYEFDGRKALLRHTHQLGFGDTVREFNIWPGLIKYHNEYGDGRPVLLDVRLGE